MISIIITCLGSEKDSVIIIENPEIHLHPKAQSRLCDFLYFVSKAERQIFVETHSDHIFNGIRAGVATSQIDRDDISVNFFALNKNMKQKAVRYYLAKTVILQEQIKAWGWMIYLTSLTWILTGCWDYRC